MHVYTYVCIYICIYIYIYIYVSQFILVILLIRHEWIRDRKMALSWGAHRPRCIIRDLSDSI